MRAPKHHKVHATTERQGKQKNTALKEIAMQENIEQAGKNREQRRKPENLLMRVCLPQNSATCTRRD